jgi:SAM-dependent methyltransferase
VSGTETRPTLRSPVSGMPLAPDGPHALCEPDGRRWPVVDGIAFLRTGRDPLVGEALACLDAGDRTGALMALLADQDDWWTGPMPAPSDLARLVEQADRLTLRDAMGLLAFGRVGDYFAHRWSDPTYLAGLALIEAHRGPMTTSFELACGIGHYGRELLRRGTAYAGADVVFAKLWLARHWVVGPDADLVCFDAASPWPVADRSFDLVLCQDAFYFLEPKAEILSRMRSMLTPHGWLAVGHVHNRGAENHSAGRGVTAVELARFFPDGIVYDDAELTRALIEARPPVPWVPDALRNVEAFAIAAGPGLRREPQRVAAGHAMPVAGATLRPNPLYGGPADPHAEPSRCGTSADVAWEIRFPSDRYAAEYGHLATYPNHFVPPADPAAHADAVRCRALVDLPERW